MNHQAEFRKKIRKMIADNINNLLEKQEETATKQSKDASNSQVLGEPLDVKMNQRADETGSDEQNAPTVAVSAGAKKTGTDPSEGQAKANFNRLCFLFHFCYSHKYLFFLAQPVIPVAGTAPGLVTKRILIRLKKLVVRIKHFYVYLIPQTQLFKAIDRSAVFALLAQKLTVPMSS